MLHRDSPNRRFETWVRSWEVTGPIMVAQCSSYPRQLQWSIYWNKSSWQNRRNTSEVLINKTGSFKNSISLILINLSTVEDFWNCSQKTRRNSLGLRCRRKLTGKLEDESTWWKQSISLTRTCMICTFYFNIRNENSNQQEVNMLNEYNCWCWKSYLRRNYFKI